MGFGTDIGGSIVSVDIVMMLTPSLMVELEGSSCTLWPLRNEGIRGSNASRWPDGFS